MNLTRVEISVFLAFSILYLSLAARQNKRSKAEQLLSYDAATKQFVLNSKVWLDISKLRQPVFVLSAVGDARIGKSTTLNLVRHFWDETSVELFEEAFPTGDTHLPVTQGIWALIIPSRTKDQADVLLLDVEGLDLGNDAVTNHLSMFTALLSSGVNIFVRDTVQNHILDFLYHISRLSQLYFPEMNFENLPQLGIVLRGALQIPQGYTREEFIKDFIANTAKQDGMDQERSVIAKYFPRDKISATQIPYVTDVEIFKDERRLMKSDFADAIRSLVKQWKGFPPKRALTGAGLMDGDAIARLVKQLFDTMNTNSWLDFGSAYMTLEREVCAKNFDEFVRPVLSGSADEIEASFERVMAKFAERCDLEADVEAARKELLAVKEKARELEEKETKLAEEKVKRERADEERKLAEEKHVKEKAEKEEEIRQEKTRREEVVKENDKLKDKIEDLSKQVTNPPPGGQNDLAQFVGGVVGGLAAVALSDQRLKQDVISSPHSEYDTIGLTGVGWKWSKAAQQQFDLAGEGRGVIAQEVEKLYPFAVTTGKDGYKRVNYKALEFMMKRARQGEKRACIESLPDKDKP